MKKKIKIIDLLCYISIGDYDKLPKEFEYAGYCWFWCLSCLTYETKDENNKEINLYDYLARNGDLNDEVEILDEEDEFEDIESFGVHYSWDYIDYKNIEELKKYVNKDFQNIFDTLDKLIKNQKKIIERLKDE